MSKSEKETTSEKKKYCQDCKQPGSTRHPLYCPLKEGYTRRKNTCESFTQR